MNRVERLLAAKRAQQIAVMEGRPADVPEPEPVPSIHAKHPPSKVPPRAHTRLTFSGHARERMAQRGMQAADVYAFYLTGEREQQSDGCARYYATDQAIADAPRYESERLRRHRGSYIVVNEEARVLVTVVHDGLDSR